MNTKKMQRLKTHNFKTPKLELLGPQYHLTSGPTAICVFRIMAPAIQTRFVWIGRQLLLALAIATIQY